MGKLTIGIRLLLLTAAGILGLAIVAMVSLSILKDTMIEDRKQKVHDVVDVGLSTVSFYHDKAKSGDMSMDEAKEAAKAAIENIRYNGKEYIWINDTQPVMVMHPFAKKLVGKDVSGVKDKNDVAIFLEFNKVIEKDGGGFVFYLWPKGGQDEPVRKVSYVGHFEPWDWVVGTGVYLDDVDAAFTDMLTILVPLFLAILAAVAVFAWMVSRGITRPLNTVASNMKLLADGNTDIDNDASARSDEIGTLGEALEVFRQNTVEMQQMRTNQDAREQEAAEDRRKARAELADEFEQSIKGIVGTVSSAATELQNTAESMGNTAQQTSSQAQEAAGSSQSASGNVQTVSSAAEELIPIGTV